MMTPPLSISAIPRLTRSEPMTEFWLFVDMEEWFLSTLR
jgi:hypothetical protein